MRGGPNAGWKQLFLGGEPNNPLRLNEGRPERGMETMEYSGNDRTAEQIVEKRACAGLQRVLLSTPPKSARGPSGRVTGYAPAPAMKGTAKGLKRRDCSFVLPGGRSRIWA